MEKAKTLGILGGLGPMAGVYFYEKVTALTKASCDQEHINVILAGLADTPDRTDFILGKSTVDPTPRMVESAKILERAGAGQRGILRLPRAGSDRHRHHGDQG